MPSPASIAAHKVFAATVASGNTRAWYSAHPAGIPNRLLPTTSHCGAVKRIKRRAREPLRVTLNFMLGKTHARVAQAKAANRAILNCSMLSVPP